MCPTTAEVICGLGQISKSEERKESSLQSLVFRRSVFKLFACWVIFHAFRLLTFFKINFFKKFFQNIIRVSNGLDPDQYRHSVGPDLCPNYF